MLPQSNMVYRVMSLGFIIALLGLCFPAHAQTPADTTPNAPATTDNVAQPDALPVSELTIPSVDWDDAQQVFKQINQWVANGKVDEVDPLQNAPTHLVSNLGGVCVTLRWMGKTFGMGESHIPLSKHAIDTKSDLLHHARVATSQALQSLKVRLPQWGRLPLNERPKLLVDLQVAKASKPIPPLAAKQMVNVLSLASPDAEGLIIENTDRKTAWTWPATNLALNLSPIGVVKGMLLELGRKPSLEISLLDEANPMYVHRFDVIHFVQPNVDSKPVRLQRGMTVLEPILEHQQIMDNAWIQARYLAHRFREDGRVAATYEPTSSRYSLQDAPLDEQAMTCFALSNQLMLALDTRPDWEGYGPCSKALRSNVTYLLSIINDHVVARDPDAIAWLLMTLIAEPSLADLKSRRDELAKMLMSLQQTDGQFSQKRADANGAFVTQPVSRFNQALIHLALLKQFDQTRDKTLLEVISRSANVLTNQAAKQTLMAIPTLYAIRDLQDKLELELPIPVDTVMVIKQTRALLLNHQITQSPSMGPADVVGGFDLSRQGPNVAPSPDWRSSYGVSLLATILKDPAMRPRLAESVGLSQTELLLRSALAARFIVQLTYRPEEVFYGDSAADCVGGVRQSPWDNTLSLKATALSLLSLQQFNDAITQSLKQTATP
jgi:hypothetical protein